MYSAGPQPVITPCLHPRHDHQDHFQLDSNPRPAARPPFSSALLAHVHFQKVLSHGCWSLVALSLALCYDMHRHPCSTLPLFSLSLNWEPVCPGPPCSLAHIADHLHPGSRRSPSLSDLQALFTTSFLNPQLRVTPCSQDITSHLLQWVWPMTLGRWGLDLEASFSTKGSGRNSLKGLGCGLSSRWRSSQADPSLRCQC